MKKTILLFASLCLGLQFANAQSTLPCFVVGNTTSLVDSASFDNVTSIKIEVDTNFVNNIWQVGKLVKPNFPLVLDSSRALQTDTINNYPTNNKSAVNVYPLSNIGLDHNTFTLTFKHYYDVDSLKDSCIVQYTIDSGNTWHNIKYQELVGQSSFINYKGSIDTFSNILNGDYIAFTGKSNGWQLEQFCFNFIGFKKSVGTNFAFRFLFKSDSINTNKPGWAIDDVKIYYPYFWSGIKDINQLDLHVYPNPSKEILNIDAQNESSLISAIALYNIFGQIVLQQALSTNHTQLSTYALPTGIYTLQISLADGRKGVRKVVKE